MNGKQKKYLRGLAHDMNALVHIGKRGLSDSVNQQIDEALTDHELIKIKISAESPVDRKEAAVQLADGLDCEIAGTIGRVLILFRSNPDNPRIRIPDLSPVAEDIASSPPDEM